MQKHVLAERYELLEHIGSGGMADVYKAHDMILDRLVAVKFLNSEFADDKEFIDKFYREAKAAAKLSHPNIVSIYDVSECQGQHYIVMEYIEGYTLKTLIKEKGVIDVDTSLNIGRQIAAALSLAHKNNLIHCDIKPHNILLSTDGLVKVADFGIARAVSSTTLTYNDNVVGSVHYISPEQVRGVKISPKSDVYSLGIILYEMLTGRLPFEGDTPVNIALKHLQEVAPSVREIKDTIPGDVEFLVINAMEKDEEYRPSSQEILKDFDELIHKYSSNLKNNAGHDIFVTQSIPVPNEKRYGKNKKSKNIFGKMFSSRFLLVIASVLIVGFLGGAFVTFGKFWSTAEVKVPNVIGKQMAFAKQIIETSGLRIKFEEEYNADVPVGNVISQNPAPDSIVKEQRIIVVHISKGGETIEMPDLKGMAQLLAEEKIKKSGLKLGNVYEKFSNDTEKGKVLQQDPKSHSKIIKGQVVELTVSKGAENKLIKLPDFTGATLEFTRLTLNSLKLRTGSITRRISSQPKGTIISQTPAAGSEVAEATTVHIVVSDGVSDEKNIGGKNNDSLVPAPDKNSGIGKTK